VPQFKYVGDDAREFPHVPVSVAPGDVVEADENPYPRYFEAVTLTKAAPAAKED
jgi:hypothetical protein